MAVLRVENLIKTFPSVRRFFGPHRAAHTAVNGISFIVNEGEILALLGPNGAGKTTTVQMLLSTMQPTSGTIFYFDQDLATHRSEILGHVGFASTYAKLPERLTVRSNLRMYGRLYGLSSRYIEQRIEHCLSFFDMKNRADTEVGVLSAGETTRVVLAKAFLANPKIVILDEPTASLDPDVAQEVRHFVLRQRNEFGTSFLITSHNMNEVSQLCDRVLILKNGRIIDDSTPENLARRIAKTRVVLHIDQGLDQAVAYTQQQEFAYTLDGHALEIQINEHEIAQLLMNLSRIKVEYCQISIEKPTLEDYFLQVLRASPGVL